MRAIEDNRFIRGDVPMTKREVRVYILDALDINEGERTLDIGAGTGSVSIEMAMRGAIVDAVETNAAGINLIKENAKKFGVNINTVNGMAPDAIPNITYDKIFVGGSKGNLKEIIKKSYDLLKDGGVLVMSFILPKNFAIALETMSEFKIVESALIQSSNVNKIGMMMANNPVFIVRGVK